MVWNQGRAVKWGRRGKWRGGIVAGLPSNARIFISISGQSNALGTDSQPALLTTQAFDGLRQPGRPGANDATAIALVESDIAPNFGESPATAMADLFTELDPLARDLIVHNWAVGSTPYSGLSQGNSNYTFGQTGVSNARAWVAANRTDEVFYPAALVWVHGENDEVDQVSASAYAAFMVELQSDFQTDVQALCNVAHTIPLVLVQHGASTELNPPRSTAEVAIGQWIAARDNANIYLACPEYPLPYGANSVHLTNVGARRLGRYIGRALKRILVDGVDWKPLQPSGIVAADNIVTVTFEGGDGSSNLVLDTTNVAQRSHTYGFDYSDGQSDIPAITGVSVAGRTAILTLSRNAQSPARVTYANYGAVTEDPGPSNQLTVGGNVRDQDTTPTGDGDRALENWAVNFDAAVDSVTGSASATRAFANTQSLNGNGTSGALVSARALSTLNGLADCTWEMYIRSNAASWPTGNNVFMSKTRSGQRAFDIRRRSGGPAGSLTVFLSTTLSDAANFTDYSGFSGNTWYHVVIVKSGTTLTLYRNDAVVAGTLTGSIPANLMSPTSDLSFMSAGSGASADFNVAHICLYTRALSAADVTERYNGGTVIDPRNLSTGGPNHYWPLQGNGEDLGSSATRNLFFYGSTMTFEAIAP